MDEYTEALVKFLKAQGYIEVKVLKDGSVAALGDLIFTRAIHLGCHSEGFERRFCFGDREQATREFAKLESEDDTPIGWIARRGRG